MPEQQPELNMFTAEPTDANVAWLERLLHASANWMTAAEILAAVDQDVKDDHKRYIRQLASASQVILSGPGSPGYKHLAHCTPEEIKHYTNAGIAQGKQMVKRAIRLRRSAHKIFG